MASESELSLAWNVCTRSQWDAFLCQVGKTPLEQSWAYGDAMTTHYGQTVERIVIQKNSQPVAILQVLHKPLFGFASIMRLVRGPVFLEKPTDDLRYEVYRAIHDVFPFRRWKAPLWSPEEPDKPESHLLMNRIGTRRMVTGLSSAWLDLSLDEDTLMRQMTGAWRNALRSAEKGGTSVVVEDVARVLPDLMEDYDNFRKGKRFVGPPGQFITAMADVDEGAGQNVVAPSAHVAGKRIAGMVLIRHGLSATYFVSWTSDAGRQRKAHNLLLWHGIQQLKHKGTLWLELGGLNTVSAAGIARFKLGLNPEPFTLAGTYL